jgi:hypothetical protein
MDLDTDHGEQDKGTALQGKSILEVVQSATEAPVRNNGGGHYNHSCVATNGYYSPCEHTDGIFW